MIHILIVEADTLQRNTYVEAFKKAGFSVAGAASAQTAIGMCEEQKPDVIILELLLKEHSGVEFLHELRSYPEWSSIPVILNTLCPRSDLKNFNSAFKILGVKTYAYKPETTLKKLISITKELIPITV